MAFVELMYQPTFQEQTWTLLVSDRKEKKDSAELCPSLFSILQVKSAVCASCTVMLMSSHLPKNILVAYTACCMHNYRHKVKPKKLVKIQALVLNFSEVKIIEDSGILHHLFATCENQGKS